MQHSAPSIENLRTDYAPPMRVEDPSKNLAVTVSLRATVEDRWTERDHPLTRSWIQARSVLADGSRIECLAICAAEHYANKSGESMVNLVCSEGSSPETNKLVHMRWLYVYRSQSSIYGPDYMSTDQLPRHLQQIKPDMETFEVGTLQKSGKK